MLGVCKALAQKLPAGGLRGEVTAHVTGQPPQSQVPAPAPLSTRLCKGVGRKTQGLVSF